MKGSANPLFVGSIPTRASIPQTLDSLIVSFFKSLRASVQNRLGPIWSKAIHWGAGGALVWPRRSSNSTPQKVGRQRTPGLRFGDRRVQALCAALQAFCFLPHGFRRQDLLERVAPLLGTSADSWPPGRASYDLRRLRLRGLIECLPRTHRYRVTRKGRRIATCFHRVYARVLRPGLSVAFAEDAPHPAPSARLLDRLDAQIDRLWKGQCVVAYT